MSWRMRAYASSCATCCQCGAGFNFSEGVADSAGCALVGGDEALEFVEPILGEDYLGWELRTQHQEPTVGSQS